MADSKLSLGHTITGLIFVIIGLGVFAIRLGHDGPYAMPHSSALIGGLTAMFLGGLLMWSDKPKVLGWIILGVSPFALFPAIYSIVGESEEVISLYATDSENSPADLRLWIVDREDGAWVGMPRWKATEHSLDGAKLEMLRSGELVCVQPVLNQDQATTQIIHRMKVEKYVAAQMAGAIGLYPLEAGESTVVLRLDPCQGS